LTVSFWFRELGGEPPTRSPLPGPREADVCVVGGGFTGLWTAYELCRAEPGLDVVVLEREYVGFGASGRNGGWVVGELAGSRARRAAEVGRDAVLAQQRAIEATVDEVGAVVEREGIDCDFVKGGSLHLAQSPTELRRLEAEVAEDREWASETELLDAAALAERVRIRGALGARFTPDCARIQPAKLVRGLASAAERAGATIHESTPVRTIEPHVARTDRGDVRARWIVRATEAYGAEWGREVVPVNSAMIVTEPLGADARAEIGWDRAETLLDGAHLYTYLQRTADGRIAIGGRGIPYRFGSRTDREGPLPRQTVEELRRRLVRLFGNAVADAPIADAWHGVLGIARDWAPTVGADPATGIAWAGGYAGEGVAAANLGGRTLCDLLLGRETALTRLPWVRPPARRWEPEPLRWLGIRSVYALLRAADRREQRTGRPSSLAGIADRVAGRG
jgi:glycine/D-amino acid oxidase-like deaminating enzyme